MSFLDEHTKLVVSICVGISVLFLIYNFYCCWISYSIGFGEKVSLRFYINPFVSYEEGTSNSIYSANSSKYLENLKVLANSCSAIVSIALVIYASMLLVLVDSPTPYDVHDHILYTENASGVQKTFYAAFAIQHYLMFFIMSIICYSWGMVLPITAIQLCNHNLLKYLPRILTFMEVLLFLSLLISLIGDFATNFSNPQGDYTMIHVMIYLQGSYDILFGSLVFIIGISLFIHLSYSVLGNGYTKYSILLTTILYTGSYFAVGLSYLQAYSFKSSIISPFFNILPLFITSFLMRPHKKNQYRAKDPKLTESLIDSGMQETQLTSTAYKSISI